MREDLQLDLSDRSMTSANSTSQLVRSVPESQTATRFPVSVIILTFNESENIASVICWNMEFPEPILQTGCMEVDLLFSPANE